MIRIRYLILLLPGLLSLTGLKAENGNYDIHYKLGSFNARVATADISWKASEWNGKPALCSEADLRATPIFRVFINKDFYAKCFFSPEELSPLYFVNPFKKKGKTYQYEYLYRTDTGEIESTSVLPEGTRRKVFPNDGQTMDLLCLLHFVRFLDPSSVTKVMPLTILMSGKAYPSELLYLGEDLVKFPGIPAQKFLLRLPGGLMTNGSGNEIYIWRSREGNQLLGLETALSKGHMSVKIRPTQ